MNQRKNEDMHGDAAGDRGPGTGADADIPSFDLDEAARRAEAGSSEDAEIPDEDLTDEELILRLEQQRDEMRAKWMRALADFRNFQQRSFENEKQAREDGRTAVVRALMPALDNLDLALAQQDTGTPAEQLVAGMRSVAEQLREIFGGVGVNVIRPEPGAAFDPHLHQAVLQSPSLDVAPGHVMNVIQSGYTLGDRVLRPAGVIVATEPSAEMREKASRTADEDSAG